MGQKEHATQPLQSRAGHIPDNSTAALREPEGSLDSSQMFLAPAPQHAPDLAPSAALFSQQGEELSSSQRIRRLAHLCEAFGTPCTHSAGLGFNE